MNILSHALVAYIAVGQRCTLEVAAGSMLSDMANAASVDFPEAAGSDLALGMRTHVIADSIFHADRAFVSCCVSMRRLLESESMSRGGSRACAHVGFELLLDGIIEPEVRKALDLSIVFETLEGIENSAQVL